MGRQVRMPLAAAVVCALVLGAASAGSGHPPSSVRWRALLPKADQIDEPAVGGSRLYFGWTEGSQGHVAAISKASGRMLWQTVASPTVRMFAAGNGVVWSVATPGASVAEYQGSSGRLLARHDAPAGRRWEWIAASGPDVYALSTGTRNKELVIYDGASTVRTLRLNIRDPSQGPDLFGCNDETANRELYIQCFGLSEQLYRVSVTSGRILARTLLPYATFCCFAHAGKSVFLESDVGVQDPFSRKVLRYDANTLKLKAISKPMTISGQIATSGNRVIVQSQAATSDVVVLDPKTLAIRHKTRIPAVGISGTLISDRSSAFLTATGSSNRVTLLRLALPR